MEVTFKALNKKGDIALFRMYEDSKDKKAKKIMRVTKTEDNPLTLHAVIYGWRKSSKHNPVVWQSIIGGLYEILRQYDAGSADVEVS